VWSHRPVTTTVHFLSPPKSTYPHSPTFGFTAHNPERGVEKAYEWTPHVAPHVVKDGFGSLTCLRGGVKAKFAFADGAFSHSGHNLETTWISICELTASENEKKIVRKLSSLTLQFLPEAHFDVLSEEVQRVISSVQVVDILYEDVEIEAEQFLTFEETIGRVVVRHKWILESDGEVDLESAVNNTLWIGILTTIGLGLFTCISSGSDEE